MSTQHVGNEYSSVQLRLPAKKIATGGFRLAAGNSRNVGERERAFQATNSLLP